VEWEGLIQSVGLAGSPAEWEWEIVSGYIQGSWLGDLMSMAKKEGIEISMINLRTPPTTKDRTIMAELIAKGYTCNILQLLNEVRIAKQLFWVPDLVTASMNGVSVDALGTNVRRSTVKWPQPVPLSSKLVGLWEDMVKYVYQSTPDKRPNEISIDLGVWHSPQVEQWVWDAPTESLFFRTNEGWERWESQETGTRRRKYCIFTQTKYMLDEPRWKHVASVVMLQEVVMVTGLTDKWRDMGIQEQEKYGAGVSDRWDDIELECSRDLQDILVVVSDGSEKGRACTYGLVAYLNGRIITRSKGVPSYLEEATSHRAEAGGLLGALEVTVVLQNRGVQFNAVKIVADNEAAIKTAQRGNTNIGVADFDLFSKLFQLQPELKVQCSYTWVKGHQDDDKQDLDIPLSLEAQVNIRADILASDK